MLHESSSRPHIVLIISHDTGRHLGCYGEAVATPHLDRLAAEGIRFEQAFTVAAQCSPSRASLLTGRYPHVNGVMGLAHLGWRLHDGERCIAHYLNDAGYASHLFGLQHEACPDEAWRLGYQVVHPSPVDNRARNVVPEVAGFLAGLRDDPPAKPLFVVAGVSETHRKFELEGYHPDDPASVRVPPYLPDGPGIRRDLAWFHGSVRALDEGVGGILEGLERSGLAAGTLVIYTTDHGIAFPRAKGMSYDPGLGVALLMRWPGRIRAGAVSGDTVTHPDLLPTLLELARAPIPEGLAGDSYAGLLTGTAGYRPRRAFFFEMTWHDRYNPHRGVREPDFKYIRNFDDRLPLVYVPADVLAGPSGADVPAGYSSRPRPVEELYHLPSDPLEQHNLAADPEQAETVGRMRTEVLSWMEGTADPLLQGPVPDPRNP